MVFLVFFPLFFINGIIETIVNFPFFLRLTLWSQMALALRILNYLNYLINKKEEKKTKNTIKVSEFDIICG